jgi:ribonuclease D
MLFGKLLPPILQGISELYHPHYPVTYRLVFLFLAFMPESIIPFRYIRSFDEMIASIDAIKAFDVVGLDVEFDRDRHAHGFTLCLIQVYAGQTAWLFDPFSLQNLDPLYRLLENNAQIKVMHAPGEDLQLLKLHSCRPLNIFDSERSARLLNFSSFSLSSLLSQVLGVEISKSQQKSNWTHSPLSEAQLRYAAADVAWLPALRSSLLNLASDSGILAWLEEENMAWDEELPEIRPDGIFYNKDEEKKIPPFQLYIYNALLAVRDKYASELNKPGYQVIDKHLLTDIAFEEALLNNWLNSPGIHPRLKRREVEEELRAAHRQASEIAKGQGLLKYKPESRIGFEAREAQKREKEALKAKAEQEWRPLWAELSKQFGEYAASYMFSDKTLTGLASGELVPDELPFAYRRNLAQTHLNKLKSGK